MTKADFDALYNQKVAESLNEGSHFNYDFKFSESDFTQILCELLAQRLAYKAVGNGDSVYLSHMTTELGGKNYGNSKLKLNLEIEIYSNPPI